MQRNVAEYEALAEELGVELPDLYESVPEGDSSAAITYLFDVEAVLQDFAEEQYGEAEAGLVQLAIHSTVARLFYDPDSSIVDALHESIEQGATKAGIPEEIIAPVLEGMSEGLSHEEVADRIDTMQAEVETHLSGQSD